MGNRRKFYEGLGPTLDAALANMSGTESMGQLEILRIGVTIFKGHERVVEASGTNYGRILRIAEEVARHNTRGKYVPTKPEYRTEVIVTGYPR